jgi:hypothetical protein
MDLGKENPAEGLSITGFVGKSAVMPAPNETVGLFVRETGRQIDSSATNIFGKYSFSGLPPGAYVLKVGNIQKEVFLRNSSVRLDIDLSAAGGTMDYAGYQTKQAESGKKGNAVPSPGGGANNSELAQQIAGVWWGYSGSTERKIGLCPNGSYQDYSESSYSGSSYDSLGNQTMAWGTAGQKGGSGTWTIQGDYQQGTIFVRYNNGNEVSIRYEQCGERGCLLFNGNKLCRSGKCQ